MLIHLLFNTVKQREYVISMGLPTASKTDSRLVELSFVSYGSCAVSASHGKTQLDTLVEKKYQSKASQPEPQRAIQAS